MKIYPVLTHIRFDAYPEKSKKGNEFTKTIKIPFLPYSFEGKRFYLTFEDQDGNDFSEYFNVENVTWHSSPSKKGSWTMCISGSVYVDRFESACEIIRNDILHKNPEDE